MERLSPLDASFLYLEGPRTPMHISSLAIYEGPPPGEADLETMLTRRLPLVPRFRQRLAMVPFGGHRPTFVDDEHFDLDTHLMHVKLPEPTTDALNHLCGRILSLPLCRTRPLWEMWMITGLTNGRFAVLSKTHHCLWDGISGVDLHAVLLDDSPDGRPDEEIEHYEPKPEPNALGLIFSAMRDRAGDAVAMARGLTQAAQDPAGAIRNAARLMRDATNFATSLMSPAPRSELNGAIGSRRRYATGMGSLHEVKDLKHTLGASVNDVVLAAVAGGIRAWQIRRGLEPQDVRVMVPVSMRNRGGRRSDGDPAPQTGNRVAMVVVDLPVTDRTALMRLDRVHHAMAAAKESGHAAAGDAITRLSGFLPPAGIAALAQAQALMRLFNLLVTNIPGPEQPLYLLGRKLLELYPQAPLAAHQAVSIAALSYNGRIGLGLLGDHDALPDIDVLARGIESSLDELCGAGALDVAVPLEPSLSRLAELVSAS